MEEVIPTAKVMIGEMIPWKGLWWRVSEVKETGEVVWLPYKVLKDKDGK
jgi:hypothetical protein